MKVNAAGLLAGFCLAFGMLVSNGFAAELPDEVPFVDGQGVPPARPNEGWKLVCKSATYKTVSEQVQVRPAGSYLEVIPAKFETKSETVQVCPERKVAKVLPARYKVETFQQLVRPECTRG